MSAALKRVVEGNFEHVRVRAELSGFKRAASGHLYMALKDEKAALDGVMWRGVAGRLAFNPEDGLEVIATGKLTTYPGRSKYQLVIEHMEPAGVGALMALLEERKKKLAAEGLFDAERNRRSLSAESNRGRNVANRRRHPRHPAPAGRSLSALSLSVAGCRAGRKGSGRSGGRDPGI